jgi:hypothetical protein
MLIDDSGKIVTEARAQLPTLQTNQTLRLPLVSASDSTVYYLDGNTAIDSLSPTGATTSATEISTGSSRESAFTVSPDDRLIAIAEISEQSDSTDDTGTGYVEDLSGGGSRVSLWDNTGSSALRWPVGWHGPSLIDQIMWSCNEPGCDGGSSYHVVDPSNGNLLGTVCETSASQPSYGTPNATITSYSIQGLPTPSGAVCYKSVQSFGPTGFYVGETDTLEAVDWAGTATTFTQVTPYSNQSSALSPSSCYLAPDGSRMVCTSNSNEALCLVSSAGTINNTGRQYNGILGWIDATHLLVDIDSSNLGVLDPDTGSLTTVAVAQANEVEMEATLPGAL